MDRSGAENPIADNQAEPTSLRRVPPIPDFPAPDLRLQCGCYQFFAASRASFAVLRTAGSVTPERRRMAMKRILILSAALAALLVASIVWSPAASAGIPGTTLKVLPPLESGNLTVYPVV